eukprot:TRINITY_DN20344_c0_g1_i1.p1 TRINITY_DN20344_c0_g1~~TRINITY_DN20344_c0_g1_i1.p1  ORF type:complete len:226 (+),score=34.78 TRINITY_DN20344_c0_g1_i1:34-678(+)
MAAELSWEASTASKWIKISEDGKTAEVQEEDPPPKEVVKYGMRNINAGTHTVACSVKPSPTEPTTFSVKFASPELDRDKKERLSFQYRAGFTKAPSQPFEHYELPDGIWMEGNMGARHSRWEGKDYNFTARNIAASGGVPNDQSVLSFVVDVAAKKISVTVNGEPKAMDEKFDPCDYFLSAEVDPDDWERLAGGEGAIVFYVTMATAHDTATLV